MNDNFRNFPKNRTVSVALTSRKTVNSVMQLVPPSPFLLPFLFFVPRCECPFAFYTISSFLTLESRRGLLAPLFLSGGPLIIICPHHCFNPPAPPPLDLTTPPSPLPLFVPVKPPPPPGRSPPVLLLLSRSGRRCDGGGCKKNSLLRKREQSLCPTTTTTTSKRETPTAVTGVGRLSVDSEQSQGMMALTGVWKRKKADHGRFSNPRKYAEEGGGVLFPLFDCGMWSSLPPLPVGT